MRQRLLTAFADLAAEVPLDDITLTAVAERAGLTRSAVYNYVTSKHDLLLAHTADVTRRWVDRLVREGGGTVADRLGRFVAATLRVFAEDRLARRRPVCRDRHPAREPALRPRAPASCAPEGSAAPGGTGPRPASRH